MPTEGDVSGEHQSIGPATRTKLSLAQFVTIVGAVVAMTATALATFYALRARDDLQDAKQGALEGAFARHLADLNAHMPENFQRAHGEPVGSFDFRVTIDRLEKNLEEIQKRPFVLDGDTCRPVHGGTLCQQKYPP
jgi:hypothetical protein